MERQPSQAEILADIAAWGKGQLGSNTTHNGQQAKTDSLSAQDIQAWAKARGNQ